MAQVKITLEKLEAFTMVKEPPIDTGELKRLITTSDAKFERLHGSAEDPAQKKLLNEMKLVGLAMKHAMAAAGILIEMKAKKKTRSVLFQELDDHETCWLA